MKPRVKTTCPANRYAGRHGDTHTHYTVICRHHSSANPCQRVVVVIRNVCNAQEAAENACLYLIWNRQGAAEAELVIEGVPRLVTPNGGRFDADDFDDITFIGEIISVT